MRVALPQWQGRIAPVFDVAGSLLIVDLEPSGETGRLETVISRPGGEPRLAELIAQHVETLICGAISAELQRSIEAAGISVLGFVCGEAEEVLLAFRRGILGQTSFAMPGCQWRRRMGHCLGRQGALAGGCEGGARRKMQGCRQKTLNRKFMEGHEDSNC